MSSHRGTAAWVLCVLMSASNAAAQDVTEREVVDAILRDGAQAAAIRASVEVTIREQLARSSLPNPSVSYSREGAGFTEFFQVEQLLPVFGARSALGRVAAAATSAAEADRDSRLWQLRGDAQTVVARLIAEQQRADLWQSSAREMEGIIRLLRVREQEGEGSRFDRLRAEQELADARQAAVDATAAGAEARALIVAAIGTEPRFVRVAPAVDPNAPVPSLEVLLRRASASRAELRTLRFSAARFEHEASAARRARIPAPMLTGGVKRSDTDDGPQSGSIFGVNISVPLFDTGRRESARWLAERARVEAEHTFAAQLVRAQVAGAAAVLQIRQDAALSARAAPPTDELTQIALVAYREGEIGMLELLDAQRTTTRVGLRIVDAHHALRLAQIALERATGESIWP